MGNFLYFKRSHETRLFCGTNAASLRAATDAKGRSRFVIPQPMFHLMNHEVFLHRLTTLASYFLFFETVAA